MKTITKNHESNSRFLVRQPKVGDIPYVGFHFSRKRRFEGYNQIGWGLKDHDSFVTPYKGTIYGFRSRDR